MHQSIPVVPIPPPGNRGAFAYVVSPGGWALAYPRLTPGHLTHVFSKDDEFIGKDETFVKDRLVRQGLEKPVDVFKGMFFSILDISSLLVSI